MENQGGKGPSIGSIVENVTTTIGDALRRAETQIAGLGGKKPFLVDVVETADAFLVEAALPGVAKDDVQVSVEAGRLTVAVTAPEASRPADAHYVCRERQNLSGSRVIDVPGANADQIQAGLKDGILTVRVPKAPGKEARKVNIE